MLSRFRSVVSEACSVSVCEGRNTQLFLVAAYTYNQWGTGGGGHFCEIRRHEVWPKIGHIETGGVPLLRATKFSQTAPRGVTLDVEKYVFVHFFGHAEGI